MPKRIYIQTEADKEILKRIFSIAKIQGIYPAQLSALSGIKNNKIYFWGKGRGAITLVEATKICQALGISLIQLVTGEITPTERAIEEIKLNMINLHQEMRDKMDKIENSLKTVATRL